MEKVKITRKQADEIEHYGAMGQEQVDYLIDTHPLNKRPNLAISNMATSELARALLSGYEVEPEFKEGDWLFHKGTGSVGKLIDITGNVKLHWIDVKSSGELYHTPEQKKTNPINVFKDSFRHATPEEIAKEKQRRWWAKHDRKPDEYKEKDIVINCDGYVGTVIGSDNKPGFYKIIFGLRDYDDDALVFHHSDLKIICFAEDRKDLKT